jgi:hypothetical protein
MHRISKPTDVTTGERIMPPTYLLVSIVAMIALHFLFPATRITPPLWNLLGIIPWLSVWPSTSWRIKPFLHRHPRFRDHDRQGLCNRRRTDAVREVWCGVGEVQTEHEAMALKA